MARSKNESFVHVGVTVRSGQDPRVEAAPCVLKRSSVLLYSLGQSLLLLFPGPGVVTCLAEMRWGLGCDRYQSSGHVETWNVPRWTRRKCPGRKCPGRKGPRRKGPRRHRHARHLHIRSIERDEAVMSITLRNFVEGVPSGRSP